MNDLIIAPVQPVPVALSAELRSRVEALAVQAQQITEVDNPEQQVQAANACKAIAIQLKEIEDSRKAIKSPLLEIGRQIDRVAEEAGKPILDEKSRLAGLVTQYQIKEEKKAAIQREMARQEQERIAKEAAELAEKARLAALDKNTDQMDAAVLDELAKEKMTQLSQAVSAPPPAPPKASGMVTRKELRYEITDPMKVFARWPHFFELKEKVSVIKGTITKEFDCPGMRVWEEQTTTFRTK